MSRFPALAETKGILLRVLADHGKYYRLDLVKHCATTDQLAALRKALQQLRHEGIIQTQGKGFGLRYHLTDKE